jgi:transposase
MPNPYPTALRERAVRAYETSPDTYADVAARFAISLNTLLRWVQRARATGDVHRSSILRALQRTGYVFKKNDRGRPNRIVPPSRPSVTPSGSGSMA